jgi:hypothetical protein
MPRLKNKNISIRLVRVAGPWSYMYNVTKWSTITDDLDLDLWFSLYSGRRFDGFSITWVAAVADSEFGNNQSNPQATAVIGKPKKLAPENVVGSW